MTQQAEPHAIANDAATGAASGATPEETKRTAHADGFGAAFCASMAALCAEIVIAGTAGVLVLLSREHDGLPRNPVLIAVVALGALLLTMLLSGFVTALTVMPALRLAGRAARWRDRDEGPLWTLAAVPAVAAAAVLVFGAVAALGSLAFAPPLTYAVWWAALSVVLLPAGLI
ncbi:hypothetical protein AB0K09_22515, partial [Streptomyces sp. NPDC049577]|uniref:hypothetical protein n=1 Tax=Streptomyces sp. NPDC049577 TaxID=3155153 RepID=UPI003422092F